jgi:putative transport protein
VLVKLIETQVGASGGPRGSDVPAPKEVDDRELLNMPVDGVDVYVTGKEVDNKTLAELAKRPSAHGVFLIKITPGAVATSIPILRNTTIHRGDILNIVGRTQDMPPPNCWAFPTGQPTWRSSAPASPLARWC